MKIRTRIALLTVFLTVGLALSVFKGEDFVLRGHLVAGQEEWVDTVVRAVAEGVAQNTIDGQALQVRDLFRRIVSKDEALAYIYVTDFEGRLFAYSFDGGFPKALAGRLHMADQSKSILYATESGEIDDVAIPLIEGLDAYLHVGVNQNEIDALIANTRADLALIVLVVGVAGLLLALIVGSHMSRPLRTLSDQVRRYGGSGTGAKIEVNTTEPDIKRLASAFNEMVEVRSQTETGMRASEKRFRELLEAAPDAMVIVNQQGEIVLVNRHAETIFGYAREALVGSPVETLIAQDIRAGHVKNRTAFTANPQRRPMGQTAELSGVTRDGRKFPVEISLSPIQTEEGLLITATVRDITEAKLAAEQLRQAQKMEAVGQLTGGVAHDFNNLLAVILGNAEIADDRRAEKDDSIEAIIRAAERGAELTQRLLAFSRRQPLNSRSIDLVALVGDVHQLLHRTLGETINIEIAMASSLWNAVADPGQMENALLNLAINARDAMPDGGKLIIETANVSLSTNHAASHMEMIPGDYVSLSVRDTGVGMSSEVMEHVFEPFFTTRDVGEGSGLGLSMVYGFAKQSGGGLNIESEIDHGTQVTLFLPRAKASVEQPEPGDEPSVPRGRGETVLVVEDEPDVRAMAGTMLENLGYSVLSAENARAGLDILKTEPAINLLLSDVVLPGGMSGPEMIEGAKAITPGIKVLFMSGHAESSIHLRTALPEGSELLDKPFRKIELAQRVRAVLDR